MSTSSKFVTKEFVIPPSPSPSPPGTPTFPGAFHRSAETTTSEHGLPLPALPDSLMEALAREPPPNGLLPSPYLRRQMSQSSRSTPHSSSTNLLPASLPTPPAHLPAIPPHSPLFPSYHTAVPSLAGPSSRPLPPSTISRVLKGGGKASLTDRSDRGTASGSDTSLLLSDGSFFSAPEEENGVAGRENSSLDGSQPKRKKSVWRSVGFGRKSSSRPSVASLVPITSTSSSPPTPLATAHSQSMSRIASATSSDEHDQSLAEGAQRSAVGVVSPSRKSSIVLSLDEEVGRLESHVQAAREASDDEGNAMEDLEERDAGQPAPGSSGGLQGPWRGRERYTHDLGEGVNEPDDSEAEGDELKRVGGSKGKALEGTAADTLYARRRQLGAEQAVPPILSVSTTLPSPGVEPAPNTAPLTGSNNELAMAQMNSESMLKARSWSDGKLSKTAEGGQPNVEELAARLGLPSHAVGGVHIESPASSRISSADFVIAVVGPRNVGKSTVIRRGLKRSSAKPVVLLQDENENRVTTCTSHFSIGGLSRSVEVLEIDMALLKYNAAGVIWPEELPKCDGAMLCYDATDAWALGSLSLLLQAFWTRGSEIPLIVLACKANADDSLNATDTKKAAEICNVYGAGIVSLEGGVEDEGKKMKNSFNWMIRTIMDGRGDLRRPSMASSISIESRRGSVASPEVPSAGIHPRSAPLPPPLPLSDVPERPTSPPGVSMMFENPFGDAKLPLYESEGGRTDGLESGIKDRSAATGKDTSIDLSLSSELPVLPPKSALQASAHDLHFSREDMVDKFLFASVTGNDEQYVTLFLIVYRRNARPYDVLSKLIERFEFVARRLKSDPLLSRFAQMKLCGVLSTWVQTYPGDFAGRATFHILQTFLDGLLPRGATWVAHFAIELIPLLARIERMDDPETAWALPDELLTEPPPEQQTASSRRQSLAPSFESTSSAALSSGLPAPLGIDSIESDLSQHKRRSSETGTMATTDSAGRTRSVTSGPERREGKGTQMGLLLEYSNALLELPEDAVAIQISRLAWDTFSEITPRDLMRHVLAPRDPKNPRSMLRDDNSNVIRSINFVNYLADWVGSMLLVQSKLKLRARLLEKFIAIAYSLREQENFDSLMGVLAGLNAQPIFRLSETMEAVNLKVERDKTKVPKRLRSLNKLMATSKGFSAYRLALANSGAHMLPYLGVHLQDITIVNEVKSDMRLGAVNWSKFQQMGRSAAIVLDCSRLAPRLPVDRQIERYVLNVPVLDKEAQYALSYTYQPRNVGRQTGFRKLLNGVTDSLSAV